MKKLIAVLVIASLYAAPGAWAQAQEPKGHARVIGGVVDSETNQPVEFANIALLAPGTGKPVDGAVCDDKGKFALAKVAPGTYDLSVSFIGYETQTLKSITVADKREDVNVGLIKLSTGAKVLTEVTVTGQKQLVEERVDRLVYNAENDQTARGGDATDVLKRVPMLSVDLDGNVSMRGSSNIQVLINNKPSTIMASSVADALKQIPADQIKSVEVITSPSAKYDAEGSGGIINIITKKNTLQGLTLNVDSGVGTRGSNLGLNGNYRQGKMGFSLGGWGRANYNVHGRFESTQATRTSLIDDTAPTINSQSADTRSNGIFGNYNLGWDYDINEKNFMTASVRLGARNNTSYQDDLLTAITTGTDTRSSLRNVKSEDLNNNVGANLSFTHQYAKPQRELSIMGSYSRNNGTNNFYNHILGESSKGSNMNDNSSYNEETTGQIDYQSPIGESQIVEFGVKDIMRRVYSKYNYFIDTVGNGILLPSTSTSLSNNLNYNQNVVGGYLSYTKSFKTGFSAKVGSRYEYTTIKAYTQTDADINIPSYGALVPSLNLSQKLSNGKTLKASYNRRIQRPSVRYLNPNIQQSNPYSVSYGNPTLSPEYTNNFELAYSTFIKATTINIAGFWRNTNNAIQEVRTVETLDTVQRVSTTYNNIGHENAVGTNIFFNVAIGKLSLNGGTDLYYSMLNNNTPVDPNNPNDPNRQYAAKNSGWVASYRMFGNYNLTKGWGFQFFGFYRGRTVQLQGTQGGFGIYSLGLKKDFNNKKGSVGFGAENFFTPAIRIHNTLSSPLVTQTSVNEMHNMSFRVNFSYRIGKMSMDAPKRRKSVNNDDLKDGDGGGDNGGGGMGGGQAGGGGRGGRGGNGGGTAPASAPAALKPADASAVMKPEGTWTYTVESPQGGEGTLVLKKDGDNYTGTINNKRFNKETPLTSVTLKGNELTFSYEVNFSGNAMVVVVKSIVTDTTLDGNMTVGQFGTFPIKGTKQ